VSNDAPNRTDAPPPLFGRWRNLYALVIGALVVQLAVFTALTWMLC